MLSAEFSKMVMARRRAWNEHMKDAKREYNKVSQRQKTRNADSKQTGHLKDRKIRGYQYHRKTSWKYQAEGFK